MSSSETKQTWFRYSNNYDFVPLPLPTVTNFGPTLAKVALRYGPCTNVTERYKRYKRYRALPGVTERNIGSVTFTNVQ